MKKSIILLIIAAGAILLYWQFYNTNPSNNTGDQIIFDESNSQLYANSEYGFQFRYPSEWTDQDRPLDITNFFTRATGGEVLYMDILDGYGATEEIARREIEANNCPDDPTNGDHIIGSNSEGTYYVLFCSMISPIYNYVFKTSDETVINLSYHDNFMSDWTEDKKLENLKAIINTLVIE